MPTPKLTADAMFTAAAHLKQSERGVQALDGLKTLFRSASGLDSGNVDALMTLIHGAYGDFAGSARDAVTSR